MQETEETIYDKIEPRLYEMLAQRIKPSECVLDIGCGECKLVNTIAKKTGSKVVGVDIHDWGIVKGMQEAAQVGVSDLVKCLKLDAQFLPLTFKEKFELAVSIYAFHEYKEPIKVLKEVKSALKPGGRILLIDFIKGSTAERLWSERYYTSAQIKNILKKVGFNKIELEFPEGKELVFIQAIKN